jgi:hypothetical protein
MLKKKIKKMDNKKIGTVEPIDGSEGYNFIIGAIAKYGNNKQYHQSLLSYIDNICKCEIKKNNI